MEKQTGKKIVSVVQESKGSIVSFPFMKLFDVFRLSSKASRSVEDLRQFAFTRSNCRSSLSQEESVPGVKSIARLNDYYLSEWN